MARPSSITILIHDPVCSTGRLGCDLIVDHFPLYDRLQSRLEAERATMSELKRWAAASADVQSNMCFTNGDLTCTRAELQVTRRQLDTTRRVRDAAEREIGILQAQVVITCCTLPKG